MTLLKWAAGLRDVLTATDEEPEGEMLEVLIPYSKPDSVCMALPGWKNTAAKHRRTFPLPCCVAGDLLLAVVPAVVPLIFLEP